MSWMNSLKAAAKGNAATLSREERATVTSDLVLMCSMGAAAVTLTPLPMTDFVFVTPVQVSMVMALGKAYGRELNLREARRILMELAGVCGLALLAQKGMATGVKLLLPGLGGVVAGPRAFAVTYGIGVISARYFEQPLISKETLRGIYKEAVKQGRELYSPARLQEFRATWGAAVMEFAKNPESELRADQSSSSAPKDAA